MIKLYATDIVPIARIEEYFINTIGGCINNKVDDYYVSRRLDGGDMDGFYGFLGHCPEKHVSWSLAMGLNVAYIETFPTSYELIVLLTLA